MDPRCYFTSFLSPVTWHKPASWWQTHKAFLWTCVCVCAVQRRCMLLCGGKTYECKSEVSAHVWLNECWKCWAWVRAPHTSNCMWSFLSETNDVVAPSLFGRAGKGHTSKEPWLFKCESLVYFCSFIVSWELLSQIEGADDTDCRSGFLTNFNVTIGLT